MASQDWRERLRQLGEQLAADEAKTYAEKMRERLIAAGAIRAPKPGTIFLREIRRH
jgi:hypothetical protein